MLGGNEISERLRLIGQNIERWRTEAQQIGKLADEAVTTGKIEDSRLIDLERTSGEIYVEIAAFNALVAEIATANPEVAAELAAVGSALQLVLLEITELGTRMYGVRSSDVTIEVMPAEVPSVAEKTTI